MPRRSADELRRASPPRSPRALAARSDDILATLAFPPTRGAYLEALRQRDELASHTRRLAAARHRLDGSGYDGTEVRHTFDLGIAEWLVASWPEDVEIDWADATAAPALSSLLAPTVLRGEEEGYDDDSISMREWIRQARGDAWPSDLAWVIDALRDVGDAMPRRATGWDAAGVPIRWKLRHAGVVHACLAPQAPVVRRTFRRAPMHPARAIVGAPPPLQRLDLEAATKVVHVARETLAIRGREVHAISYANADEVWWADLGRGTAIAVIGVRPEFRLTLEANYGFVLFANGVPVGYGGVSPMYRQANTGINLFPAFRGTEAAALWIAALRSFRALFGVRYFIASPFQVGRENAEAIASGAFWFYYRLGFRPASAAVAERAASEAARMRDDKSYRSPPATLRALAEDDLVLRLPDAEPSDFFDERWIARLSLRDTAHIAAEGHIGRHAAAARIAERVARVLGADRRTWSGAERAAFEMLAPLIEEIPDLGAWPARQRRALATCLQAKGAAQERPYVLRCAAHPRLFPALADLAQAEPTPRRPARRAPSASGTQSSRRSAPRSP